MRKIAADIYVSFAACWLLACRGKEPPQTAPKPFTSSPAPMDGANDASAANDADARVATDDAKNIVADAEVDDDYPSDPTGVSGVTREVPGWTGSRKCQVQVGEMPKVDLEIKAWLDAQERRAYAYARLLCLNDVNTGTIAVGLSCRANAPRPRLVGVRCNQWPQKLGNANPSITHALFERTKDADLRLKTTDIFTNKQSVCSIFGIALREERPFDDEHPAKRWIAMCNTRSSPVDDDAMFVTGGTMGFEMPREYWPCGNCPDPLTVPISTLNAVLTSRMKSLMSE